MTALIKVMNDLEQLLAKGNMNEQVKATVDNVTLTTFWQCSTSSLVKR